MVKKAIKKAKEVDSDDGNLIKNSKPLLDNVMKLSEALEHLDDEKHELEQHQQAASAIISATPAVAIAAPVPPVMKAVLQKYKNIQNKQDQKED